MATHARLKFDYDVAMDMVDGMIVRSVAAYTQSNRKERITTIASAWRAKYYVVDFGIRSWTGKGKHVDRVSVGIDLNSCPQYPQEIPNCYVISKPKLWHPHVSLTTHKICTGNLGSSDFQNRFNFTLAHLILHLAKLLNLDEPNPKDGFNGAAMTYWREELNKRPISPGLDYPALPIQKLYPDTPNNAPSKALRPKKPTFRAVGRRPAD